MLGFQYLFTHFLILLSAFLFVCAQGTGKTYVGARLVSVLLRNSVPTLQVAARVGGAAAGAPSAPAAPPARKLAITPILCICYTNHALDSFLLDLVTTQGVPLKDIVRIGSRSKDEGLKARGLFELNNRDSENSDEEKRAFWKIKGEILELEKAMQQGLQLSADIPLLDMIKWLFRNGFKDFQARLFPFAKVDGQGKRLPDEWVNKDNSRDILHHWLKGRAVEFLLFEQQKAEQAAAAAVAASAAPLGAIPLAALMEDRSAAAAAAAEQKAELKAAQALAKLQGQPKPQPQPQPQPKEQPKPQPKPQPPVKHATRALPELLRDAKGVLEFNAEEAQLLWNHWQTQYRLFHFEHLSHRLEKYESACNRLRELDDVKLLRILRGAKIVAVTCSGAASSQKLLAALKPRVVVCEEAGEVLESHLVASLTEGTDHLILIGQSHSLCRCMRSRPIHSFA